MPATSILGNISQEATLQELLGATVYALAAILEKMPRVTGNDQAAVSIESGSVGISSGQTLATVTTVGTVTNTNQLGGQYAAGNNLMMSGTAHIYNNIVVS